MIAVNAVQHNEGAARPRAAEAGAPAGGLCVAHLAVSMAFGGPERLMLGLAQGLGDRCRSAFLLFPDGELYRPFLGELRRHGIEAIVLENNWPRARAVAAEVTRYLGDLGADVLCMHGYKADLLGLPAARRAGLPAVAVAHGWTGQTWKVRLNEAADRLALRRMDRVICVSQAQAEKVRCAGVRADRVVVIPNAIQEGRFDRVDPARRAELEALFERPPRRIVGAAGRLSPEKGFGVLVEAAAIVARRCEDVGFVHFGDGPLRGQIEARVRALGLADRFRLAGFRSDLDALLPHLDLAVLPSFTEGLPLAALEASAAGVPIVATAVGGTPEVVEDGVTGRLVPPGDPGALAGAIEEVLGDERARRAYGERGQARIRERFGCEQAAARYRAVFESLRAGGGPG